MASGYFVALDHVESPGSPVVQATADYGDNGPGNGPDPELTVYAGADATTGRTTWSPDFAPDGSWDSGEVPVAMHMEADGQGNSVITWSVNGETALTLTVPEITSISEVDIVAGTQTLGYAAWSDVHVSFSTGNPLTADNYTASSGDTPGVSSMTDPADEGEQELWVTPANTGQTSVTVTGNIRFQLPPDSYPNPADLFAGVNVY